jgi:NADPH-dependent 2,4-dienoyl-CoA reductase/sulfur reductase-like enzyme/rhodanese-related sulfurtransferase
VVSIDRAGKTVEVLDHRSGKRARERYDRLVLAPGADPIVPRGLVENMGTGQSAVMTLRHVGDVDRMKARVDGGVQHAVVVGGGFIGLEVAEQLRHRGVAVTLVEAATQVMAPMDPEMACLALDELREHGVKVILGCGVKSIQAIGTRARVHLTNQELVEADLVLLSIGVAPESKLAREAGLKVNERGAIIVDEYQRTSDPEIYAVGDAVEVEDSVLGTRVTIPLAGPANRQGRLAADHMMGLEPRPYPGSLGTGVLRLFRLVMASAGWNEKRLAAAGKKIHVDYEVVMTHPWHHASYYPGAKRLHMKLIFARDDGRVLGVQAVGEEGVEKRVDVIAMAMRLKATVRDLAQAELSYSPPIGSAKDPVNMLGFQGENILNGVTRVVTAEETRKAGDSWARVDVRTREEYDSGHLEGATHIPVEELRTRLREIPRGKPVVVYCAVGMRGYIAQRLLTQSGFADTQNLTGGYMSWEMALKGAVE